MSNEVLVAAIGGFCVGLIVGSLTVAYSANKTVRQVLKLLEDWRELYDTRLARITVAMTDKRKGKDGGDQPPVLH